MVQRESAFIDPILHEVHKVVVGQDVMIERILIGLLTGGHILHGEHALDQLLVRPIPECLHHRTPLDGFFLCGAGSHPGGGPTCAPGRLAAAAIG